MAKDTVQKIKEAAIKIFRQKGFAETRIRDIANEAGVNSALVNYHFHSKDYLFSIVMGENMDKLREQFLSFMNDKTTDFRTKLIRIADSNAQILIENNDIILFVLTSMYKQTDFARQFLEPFYDGGEKEFGRQARALGFTEAESSQIVIDLLSMVVCPVVGKPIINMFYKFQEPEFIAMLEQRRKQIPHWVDALLAMKREM